MHSLEPRTDRPAPTSRTSSEREREHVDHATVSDQLHSPGAPMPEGLRTSMESAFGADLRGVRLHSGAAAERSVDALGARAYTVGDHVVLGRAAGTPEDHHTLVHELAHVVQQRGAPPAHGNLAVSRPGDPGERAADAAAQQVLTGHRVTGLTGTRPRQVARQVPPTGATQNVAPPQVSASAVDAQEAANRVSLALFDSGGFFAAVREVLDQFQLDMTTQLGWYAGIQTAPAPQSGLAGRIATGAAGEAAKNAGKAALAILIRGLSGATLAAGPAGVVAGQLTSAITTVVGELDNYRPVVLAEAQKPAHQVLIESIRNVITHEQVTLRNRWTSQMSESIRDLGAGGLLHYADQIQRATETVRSRFYLDLVAAYLGLGTGGQTVEVQTPHARYTGEGRGFQVFQGARYWIENIAPDEIYVEFAATGFTQTDFRIVRTLVPRLPSSVLRALNGNPAPGFTLGNLPFRRLIMETNAPGIGPVKLMFDTASARLTAADTPHFSKYFCLRVARAAGITQNYYTDGNMSSGEYAGAVSVYAWIISHPIGQLHFTG